MKFSKIKRIALCLIFAVMIFSLSLDTFTVFGKTYSDSWVLGYENMEPAESETNVVPTLYKNDAVFGNHRRFPLVVKGDYHYVPVEMFMGLSGIKLTYGYSASYFYLATKGNTKYISFDVENNAATTHEKNTYALKTEMFYNTRYLPAEAVAEVLGLKLEIYNDPEESIYALRLSDSNSKVSFSELIRMYSPIKKEETTQNPTTNTDIGKRNIYLTFDTVNFSGLSDTLAILERDFAGKSAVFFVTANDILTYPDEIRQIIAYGQSVGILLNGTDPETEYLLAKENLRLVAKRSTRLVRFARGSTNCSLDDEQYESFVKKYGLCVWDYNINITDSRKVQETVYNFSKNTKMVTAIIRFSHGTNSDTALTNLYGFIKGKNQIRVYTIDETVKSVSYR